MRKRFIFIPLFFFILFFITQEVHSQLINYSRRNQGSGGKSVLVSTQPQGIPDDATSTGSSATIVASPDTEALEEEQVIIAETANGEAPRVRINQEKRYDANHDGKLQEEEIKAFLRDVIKRVEIQGSFTSISDVLKPYDFEGDGVIRQYELGKIRQRVAEQ